jgi:hypothetical protein
VKPTTGDPAELARLTHLCEVVALESRYLLQTDGRLFAAAMDEARAATLPLDPDLAERVDAFAARFSRLQDTLGDKLLPHLLRLSAEPLGSVLDNLIRAEKLGWLASADDWVETRRLRNEMVHEYVRSALRLANGLQTAHIRVGLLVNFARALVTYAAFRFGVPGTPAIQELADGTQGMPVTNDLIDRLRDAEGV